MAPSLSTFARNGGLLKKSTLYRPAATIPSVALVIETKPPSMTVLGCPIWYVCAHMGFPDALSLIIRPSTEVAEGIWPVSPATTTSPSGASANAYAVVFLPGERSYNFVQR